jgi:REP-associated tyrosine transposase
MPRRPRIVYDNSTVHIMQRGNNRSTCFFTDDDYVFYLAQLAQACREHRVDLHAYVLLPNRVNLLLSASDGQAPSRVMKQVGQRYVQFINRTYQRSGTLWEGRFRSCIVNEKNYILGCQRYVEMSPVRAGIAAKPGDYRWSSYRANAGDEESTLLTSHPFLQPGIDAAEITQAYREFTLSGDSALDEHIRMATNGNLVLGSADLQRKVGTALDVRTWRGKAGRPQKNVEKIS